MARAASFPAANQANSAPADIPSCSAIGTIKEKTDEVLDAAGWMHTGDLATLDEHGYGNIVGRIKDMIIRGGENLYPREIEEFLFRHPKIQEVQVFGVADAKYGEELCAWIKVRDGEAMTADEVREFCEGQIAHQKVPRYVEFVEFLPDDRYRQGAKIPDAQDRRRAPGAESGRDRLIVLWTGSRAAVRRSRSVNRDDRRGHRCVDPV